MHLLAVSLLKSLRVALQLWVVALLRRRPARVWRGAVWRRSVSIGLHCLGRQATSTGLVRARLCKACRRQPAGLVFFSGRRIPGQASSGHLRPLDMLSWPLPMVPLSAATVHQGDRPAFRRGLPSGRAGCEPWPPPCTRLSCLHAPPKHLCRQTRTSARKRRGLVEDRSRSTLGHSLSLGRENCNRLFDSA